MTAIGGRAWTSSLCDSCVIYLKKNQPSAKTRPGRSALRDLLLQYLALRGLGVSEVHHLVEQFVYNDKVIPDALLLQHLEILGEHLDDFMQE